MSTLGADRAPRFSRVCFGSSVRLTAPEVFDACQALADADRFLVRAGRLAEAGALGDLFELLEDRLTSAERRRHEPPPLLRQPARPPEE
jgi:hypothetical protein